MWQTKYGIGIENFGHAAKTISSLDIRSPCIKQILNSGLLWAIGLQREKNANCHKYATFEGSSFMISGAKKF